MKNLFFFIGLSCFIINVKAQKPVTHQKLIQKLTSQPEFPGGDSVMNEFLCKNLRYGQMERDNDIQGRVVVRFMVDTDGAIQDIKVLKKVSPGLDKEAIRVVKLMPKWNPAMYHNKPVAVYYILPVKFYLQ